MLLGPAARPNDQQLWRRDECEAVDKHQAQPVKEPPQVADRQGQAVRAPGSECQGG